jgi:myosin heavy subunit
MQADSNIHRGVSFDRVRDAVEKLTTEGRPISAGTIREVLGGTGSKTTILKHLTALRERQGAPGHIDTSGLADDLIHLLAKEVARVAGERTVQLGERLGEAQHAISSLIEENDELGDELLKANSKLEDTLRSLSEQLGVERELRNQLAAASEQRHELEMTRQRLAAADAERASLQLRLDEVKGALGRAESRIEQVLERVLDKTARSGKVADI